MNVTCMPVFFFFFFLFFLFKMTGQKPWCIKHNYMSSSLMWRARKLCRLWCPAKLRWNVLPHLFQQVAIMCHDLGFPRQLWRGRRRSGRHVRKRRTHLSSVSKHPDSHGCLHSEFTGGNLQHWRSSRRVTELKNSPVIDPTQRPERLRERPAFGCDFLSAQLKRQVG